MGEQPACGLGRFGGGGEDGFLVAFEEGEENDRRRARYFSKPQASRA